MPFLSSGCISLSIFGSSCECLLSSNVFSNYALTKLRIFISLDSFCLIAFMKGFPRLSTSILFKSLLFPKSKKQLDLKQSVQGLGSSVVKGCNLILEFFRFRAATYAQYCSVVSSFHPVLFLDEGNIILSGRFRSFRTSAIASACYLSNFPLRGCISRGKSTKDLLLSELGERLAAIRTDLFQYISKSRRLL